MKLGVFFFALALPAATPLKVLIVDGANNHDWKTATREVKAILQSSGRFQVDVSTYSPQEWHPNFEVYDAVLLNFNGGHKEDGLRWPAEVEQALESYVTDGGGLIIYHAANNAFLNWPAYNDMIGLGWRDKTFGPSLIVSPDEKIVVIPQGEGRGPGHGPRHDFEMTVLDKEHPITKGFPKHWMHASEQLTHGQHGPAKDLTILTYAWSKDTKENEPMDWVRNYSKGRIYVTMLGHTWKNEPNPNLEDPYFRALLSRGVEWAASGRVTIPVP